MRRAPGRWWGLAPLAPDATIVSATVQRGDEAVLTLTGTGPWTLATDRELAAKFGHEWFKDAGFLALVDGRSHAILLKAQKDAAKHWPKGKALPSGKVIAELTFGFWLQLTDSKLEHKLWVPCLHKAFAPRKAPKRAIFNQQLEKLRQLRNRVAHHEPIFHLDLLDAHHRIFEVGQLLCPTTARVMDQTSTVQRQVMGLNQYCKQRGL